MITTKQFFFITLMFLIPTFSYAEKASENTLHELMLLSGLKSQINDLPAALTATMQQMGATSQAGKQSQQIFIDSFQPDMIINDVTAELRKVLSEKEAQKLIGWYESNLGNRIARAEEAAGTPNAMVEIQQTAAQLMGNAELMAAVKNIAEAGNIFEETFLMQEAVTLKAIEIAEQMKEPSQRQDVSAIANQISSMLISQRPAMEQSTLVVLAYTYRDFDTRDLAEYAEFLKQPAMRKFNKSGFEGGREALGKALERMILAMKEK